MARRIPIHVAERGDTFITVRVMSTRAGINDNVPFLVDTGAFDLFLSQDDLKKLGLELGDLRPARRSIDGIAGKVKLFEMHDVVLMFPCAEGNVWEVQLHSLYVMENPRSKRHGEPQFAPPSLLGREFMEDHVSLLY